MTIALKQQTATTSEAQQNMIIELARGPLLTRYGDWTHIVYWDGITQAIAMVYGDVADKEAVPTRVHSACITSHVFLSVECDCREQMEIAMVYIQRYASDSRRYEVAAEILRTLRVRSVTVLTNNPSKVEALKTAGLPIVQGSARVMIKPDNVILEKQYRDKIAEGHWLQMNDRRSDQE